MELDRIRNMNDDELKAYLQHLSSKKLNMCLKCGNVNAQYTINIMNRKKTQQKKLCNLCNKCYTDLLDYLGIEDIMWD